MSKQRDLTEQEFRAKLKHYGFGEIGPMGYVRLPIEGLHMRVSILNAGRRLRDKLAYLLRETEKQRAKMEKESEGVK